MIPFADSIDKIPVSKGFLHLWDNLTKLQLKLKTCEHQVAQEDVVFHIFEHHSTLTCNELQTSCGMLLAGNVDNVQDVVKLFFS